MYVVVRAAATNTTTPQYLNAASVSARIVSEEYALPVLYNHTVASGHSFDVLGSDRSFSSH
jgi:hypothetical protein